ncbi:MAG: hypothetical protein ACTHON_14065, partial [Humibacter sp.]
MLNIFGILIVTIYLVAEWIGGHLALWAGPFAVVSVLAWLVVLFVPDDRRFALLARILFLIMVVCGALTAW